MTATPENSAASPDYGTPPHIVESARRVMGSIDVDPCTSELFNDVVKAKTIFTRLTNGLKHDWMGNALVNAPGEDGGVLVKRFWEYLIKQYAMGCVDAALWVGFNINQLQTLQKTRVDAAPMHFPFCVPSGRLNFSETTKDHQAQLFGEPGRELVEAKQPTRVNFIGFLPDRRKPWQAELFRSEFSKYGTVVIP